MAVEQVDYSDGDVPLTGFLMKPEGRPRAAVLVLPTIANCNTPMIRRAHMLAQAGYLAMIADFYGVQVRDFDHARELAGPLRSCAEGYRQRLRAGLAALTGLPEAQALPVAAVGYCMGGQAALELARDGADLVLAASFHGLLDTQAPASPGAIKARILVCHGDADPMVPRSQVLAFWEEMDAAGANWHFHSYSGVRHGFTDPGSDERGMAAIGYDASADRQSWAALMELLDEVLAA
ncbi:dienelactone hydrolase family protein [Novosphingobium taihuense]|uniref:Dienelactone hydrolase n=1 Tax=Novosphingobium taihuense TaxID=260085 RepID=A0A7W7AFX5_9SPHN|nr:dienelactone hydrolase family protein [Novosphingobium taihuense]MBB4615524.1 dienelactone hydrolase [Novosphingobium taihuense]TWH82816.1 dienelactone hydrolase [Novosphingobium taihuense]